MAQRKVFVYVPLHDATEKGVPFFRKYIYLIHNYNADAAKQEESEGKAFGRVG